MSGVGEPDAAFEGEEEFQDGIKRYDRAYRMPD